jgi:hypothetical protein
MDHNYQKGVQERGTKFLIVNSQDTIEKSFFQRVYYDKPSERPLWKKVFQKVYHDRPSERPLWKKVFQKVYYERPSEVPSKGLLTEHPNRPLKDLFKDPFL